MRKDGLRRHNEISKNTDIDRQQRNTCCKSRKDETDKTREQRMGILGSAETELELNEKRWMPKMKGAQLKEGREITEKYERDDGEAQSTGSLEAQLWHTVTSPHGKKAPETTIKSVLPVLLSPHRGRDLLKVCAALWGLKHTTAATEEKWGIWIQYREKTQFLSGVQCRCKYIHLCISLCAVPRRQIAVSMILLTSMLFLLQSVSEHRGEMGRWEKRKSSEHYQKST